MPVNDELGKRMEKNSTDETIAVALINGDTGQPFDTKEDFFNAVRKLVTTSEARQFYNETNPLKDFDKDVKRLVEEYMISKELAACHLCNWEDTYLCHTFNGGCSLGLKCSNIYESEQRKGE
jgi:hypothetical protein